MMIGNFVVAEKPPPEGKLVFSSDLQNNNINHKRILCNRGVTNFVSKIDFNCAENVRLYEKIIL